MTAVPAEGRRGASTLFLWLQEKLAAAVKKAEEFNEAAAETDVRKRKYNASAGDNADVTPEEVRPPPHF